MIRIFVAVFLMAGMAGALFAQEFKANYDESGVPDYTLPDPLIFENGMQVKNVNDWQMRRAEILTLFEDHVYGISPSWKGEIIPEVLFLNSDALSGSAIIQEINLTLKNGMKQHSMRMLLCLPKSVDKAPVFLGYNFNGNHTVINEPTVVPVDIWNEDGSGPIPGDESERGASSRRWPIEEIIARGYGVATIYYCDVDPDFDDGFKNGVHGLFDSKPDDSSWGSIAAWAWGLSCAMDFLEAVPEVNSEKVIVIGHSRLGKAALWAGASDNRFAMVISNNSGCGGAALSKRVFGETVGRINRAFPHWFCENFNKYNEKEEILPVDQHELLALIAPRPLYVASASEDQWADPRGEFLACSAASPVYVLLGKEGLPVTEMPGIGKPVSGSIGYHIRKGKHDILLYDWLHYLDFADKHL